MAAFAEQALPSEVGLSVRVRRTFDLDNIKENFGINLHILMRWETDEGDPDDDVRGWEPEWTPRWVIKNVLEIISE